MIRALVERLNFGSFDMLKALEIGVGQTVDKITAIGGGTRNTFWMQNKADISGLPVVTLEIEKATAQGAAMLAGVGVGIYRDLSEAAARIHRPGKTFEPNLHNVSLYSDLYGIYKEIYPSLRSLNMRIYERFRG